MKIEPRKCIDALRSGQTDQQNEAFRTLMEASQEPVPWAYDIWDDLVELLENRNNRTRAIAAQVLCNLAKSDPDNRMLDDVDALVAVTRDERFVTARHCLQSLWKVGVAGERQRERLLALLESRFHECANEKNCTLIRYDILAGLRNIYDATGGDSIHQLARTLIDVEPDPGYRKKYGRLWSPRSLSFSATGESEGSPSPAGRVDTPTSR